MSDLDSFFAKKDKKKGSRKTANKFTTTEELSKKLEEMSVKKDKCKKDKSQSGNVDPNNSGGENEDEWKEFQEDKKDYSGLKLQFLIMNEGDNPDSDKNQNDSNEEGFDGTEGGRKPTGPWKMQNDGTEAPVEPAPKPPTAGKSSGVYVLPMQKQVLGTTNLGDKRSAPDMNSTVAFPTLQSALTGPKPMESVWNKRKPQDDRFSSNDSGRSLNDSGKSTNLANIVSSSSSGSSSNSVYLPPQRRH